jgi:L-glutamine-phosphate cytidylyltransferase
LTKALILAAGQGSRLRPLTNSRPKCLVKLNGETLLSRQIRVLRSEMIEDIHVVTGYLADQIKNLGLSTSHNKNFDRTNMVSSFFCAMEFINSCKEDLIISYGDIVYDPENLRALLESSEEVSLMIDQNWKELWSLRIENPLDDAETLKLDENNLVTELGKKPINYDEIQGQYTGLIKIRADMLEKLVSFYKSLDRGGQYDGNDFSNMYMTSFIQLLINSGWNVKAVNVINGWLEVDTVADLTVYEKLAQRSELQKFYRS